MLTTLRCPINFHCRVINAKHHTHNIAYILSRSVAVGQNVIEVAMVNDEDSSWPYDIPEVGQRHLLVVK